MEDLHNVGYKYLSDGRETVFQKLAQVEDSLDRQWRSNGMDGVRTRKSMIIVSNSYVDIAKSSRILV